MNTRRQFLITAPLGFLVTAAACHGGLSQSGTDAAQTPATGASSPRGTPGAPPTFGTGTGSGPEVTSQTFAEAEKLMQIAMTPAQRQQAADSWRATMAPYLERRTGPRKVAIAATDTPALLWNPALPGVPIPELRERFVRSSGAAGTLPGRDEDIAFAPVSQLSRWIESRKLTSERLTTIYLGRIARFDSKTRAIITLTMDHALARAKQADMEIAAGRYRGPLHGIPYGVKDLLDTNGIPTTYGAEPFRNRVPSADSAVVRRLNDAGAVMVAKLSLGALALNDIWFGGQTMNPWLLEEGASGSSAGPGAATAAAYVAFAVGSETGGSIVAPAMRCGVTGFRPTFGRVARTGAMTLCWSLDKLGPMARSVEDAMFVLQAMSGPDGGDPSSVPSRLDFDANAPIAGLKVGYIVKWMQEAPATDVDRAAMDLMKKLGMQLKAVELPDWPYDSLNPVLFAEGAASFEDLALNHQLETMRAQVKDAWPNLFRQARFLSAVDTVQADRLRRKVALEMARIFNEVDLLMVPSLRDEQLVITNFTGHPSLTMRAGFVHVSEARSDWAPDPEHPLPKFNPPRRVPHGITILGRLFDDGLLGRVGVALERAFGVVGERPTGF
jgi:Asp-tRNA(Asn)/Glu-tRNA(Gln) amidotransferase A subunit family amidase